MSVAWAIMWFAFSLFIDAELVYDAVMHDPYLAAALTLLPISIMFYVERKMSVDYPAGQSNALGQVLLMLSRMF